MKNLGKEVLSHRFLNRTMISSLRGRAITDRVSFDRGVDLGSGEAGRGEGRGSEAMGERGERFSSAT